MSEQTPPSLTTNMNQVRNSAKIGFSDAERSTLFALLRHVLYYTLMTLSILGMWKLGKIYGSECVAESGIIENIEIAVLLVCGIIFLGEAFLTHQHRALAFWLSALCFAATCREMDYYFEQVLPIISWKFCYLFPIAALVYAAKNRTGLRDSLMAFLHSHAFHLLLCSVLVIVIISQAIAHRSFLTDVLGNDIDMSLTRRVIEEPIEMVGYMLILFSTMEFYIELIARERRK